MRIGLSTGWAALNNYWGRWPFEGKMMGGSENTLVQVATELARIGHEVSVRLPYDAADRVWAGVRWLGSEHPSLLVDALFAFDDYERRDHASASLLVVTRSDPPQRIDFDDITFWSHTHARLLGHPNRLAIGGGVRCADYTSLPRIARRVICTSSPDRCPAASGIGRGFDFVHTYKSVPGIPIPTLELSREDLVRTQSTAMIQIHPYEVVRESEFFCMSVLEALAAGTPCVISDGPALVELWGEVSEVLPRPIDMGQWSETIEELLANPLKWRRMQRRGEELAKQYDWSVVAPKYLSALGV